MVHSFLSFTVAIFVYKLGYGFDNFIHEATFNLIDENGLVYPKPFYYLGQYSLIIIFHKLFFIPISALNKLLVPLLAAIFLPLIAFQSLQKIWPDKKQALLSIVLLLALPFSIFIISTPQNLAYFFLAAAVLLSLTCQDLRCLIMIFVLAAAALLTQPIAGIPALIFVLILTIYHSELRKYKKRLMALLYILATAALPVAFVLIGKIDSNIAAIDSVEGSKINIFSWLQLVMPGKENFWLNFIYLYGFNSKLIIATIIAV